MLLLLLAKNMEYSSRRLVAVEELTSSYYIGELVFLFYISVYIPIMVTRFKFLTSNPEEVVDSSSNCEGCGYRGGHHRDIRGGGRREVKQIRILGSQGHSPC